MATRTRKGGPRVSDVYFRMVKQFPLVSIKSESQLRGAQKIIDDLLMKGKLSRGEETYLDALSDLVAAYEDVHYPIDPPPQSAMLTHLLETRDMSPSDLQRELGVSQATIADVLNGKKRISPALGRRISELFKVDQGVLHGSRQ